MIGYPLEAKDIYIGRECNAKFKNLHSVWSEHYIPIRITQKYEKFWVAEVLPHKSTAERACGISKPYTMTIKRHEIKCGDVILKERR